MRILLIAIFSCSCFIAPAQQHAVTKIILVRHAEKANDGTPDPSLSDAGKKRAIYLSKLLNDVPVDSLYTTPFKRTEETLTPLSIQKCLPVNKYNPADNTGIQQMIERNKGKTIIIAGHSNTVPILVNKLIGENKFKQMDDDDYGKIWIFIFKEDKLIDCSLLNY